MSWHGIQLQTMGLQITLCNTLLDANLVCKCAGLHISQQHTTATFKSSLSSVAYWPDLPKCTCMASLRHLTRQQPAIITYQYKSMCGRSSLSEFFS